MAENGNYFRELAIQLRRAGLQAGEIKNGRLRVLWNGESVCRVADNGVVFYNDPEVRQPQIERALFKAEKIARSTYDYVKQMETAPPLTVEGLDGDYRLLSEFNGTVLAGHPTKYGVQFITWDFTYGRTGLWQGHYHMEDYEGAKQDFATRSSLIDRNRLLSDQQLAVIFDACQNVQVYNPPGNPQHEKLLEEVIHQAETVRPDIIDLANELTQWPQDKEQEGFGMEQQGQTMYN